MKNYFIHKFSSLGICVWDLWSSDDSEDEELLMPERRQYNVYEIMK